MRFEGRNVPAIKFIGHTLPGHLRVGLSETLGFTLNKADGQRTRFEVSITDSIVTVECSVTSGVHDELAALYQRARHYAQCVMNTFSFANGIPFSAVLDECIDHRGVNMIIETHTPGVENLCTAYKINDASFGAAFNLISGDVSLSMAFDDLLGAARDTLLATVNCARMLDALRKMVAGPETRESDQWEKLRKTLNLTREYVQPLTDNSIEPRHGVRTGQSSEIVQEVIKRSWTIMNRFLEYRMLKGAPLPLDRFPILG